LRIFYAALVPALLLWIAYSMVHAGKRLLHVDAEEIAYPGGSLWPLILRVWWQSAAALTVSLLLNFWISLKLPWAGDIHSEWGFDFRQEWGKYLAYISMWSLLYFALLMFTHFVFRRYIKNKVKARRMCFLHAAAAALILHLINSIPFPELT